MELLLSRMYHPEGTNGILRINQELFCYTIELPWRGNLRNISCIPEGRYRVVRRFSPHFLWHMHVRAVKGRSFILIHSANDAATQLKGCIAPVSALTADPGKGKESKKAYERLKATVYAALARKEPVWLNIAELATAAAPSVHY